jgi:hypothetical protein
MTTSHLYTSSGACARTCWCTPRYQHQTMTAVVPTGHDWRVVHEQLLFTVNDDKDGIRNVDIRHQWAEENSRGTINATWVNQSFKNHLCSSHQETGCLKCLLVSYTYLPAPLAHSWSRASKYSWIHSAWSCCLINMLVTWHQANLDVKTVSLLQQSMLNRISIAP